MLLAPQEMSELETKYEIFEIEKVFVILSYFYFSVSTHETYLILKKLRFNGFLTIEYLRNKSACSMISKRITPSPD